MTSRTVVSLYRLLQKQARELQRRGVDELQIRQPLSKEAWLVHQGSHGWQKPAAEFHLASLQQLAPWAAEGVTSGSLSPAELKLLIRRSFRQPPADSSRAVQLDRAFTSLRLLGEQIRMQECSSCCTTQGVHVEVTTEFLGSAEELEPAYERDDDDDKEGGDGPPPRLFFTYRVRVSNCGDEVVRILGRHWVIADAAGAVITEVPRGSKGVVGCTPIIRPGQAFEYYSGTDLESRGGGSMHGSFQMAVLDPQKLQDDASWLRTFDATIAPFKFVPPRVEGSG